MAAIDDLLNKNLQEYLIRTTRAEPQLLANLRKETMSLSPLAQMLTGPIEGALLHLLVKISQATLCLELGTFTGYSALQIASALPTDGKLITCENRKEHAEIAQKYFNLSPHGHKIILKFGDATQTINALENDFDFIFIDADKANYPLYYDMLIPKLKKGGLMVVDNALWDREVLSPKDNNTLAIDALNQKARNDERVETVMLSVRDGMLLIYKN
ncbi:MAG: O-methyltransferase [Candidatus Berkiellales bacterium]